MSLIAMSLLESARRKFFMNSIMCKRFYGGRNESNSYELKKLKSARRKFFMNSTYIMSRK